MHVEVLTPVSTFVTSNFTGIVITVGCKAMLAKFRISGMAVPTLTAWGAQICKGTEFLNADTNYEAATASSKCNSCGLHEALPCLIGDVSVQLFEPA